MNPLIFKNKYKLGECDCWTFVQDVYAEEHGVKLPDYPFAIENNEAKFRDYVVGALILAPVKRATKGCIIAVKGSSWHAGYALDSQRYMHMTKGGLKVTIIPRNAYIYEYKGQR